MKKIIAMALMALTFGSAHAQIEQGSRYGITAGFGLSNVSDCDASMKLGYTAGFAYEYNFKEKLYLGSGLNIQMKGMKDKADGVISGTLNAGYITLPIHVGGRFNIGGDANYFFAQAGPQLGVGVFGSDINWYSGGTTNYFDDANRFEVGLGAKVGVEFNKFQVNLNFNYGLTKVFEDTSARNLDFGLGIAYMF